MAIVQGVQCEARLQGSWGLCGGVNGGQGCEMDTWLKLGGTEWL